MSDIELGVPLPLDSDGFLRRECPTCEREFKWLPAQGEAEATPPADGGYFCPYCGVAHEAPVSLVEAVVRQVVGPALDKFGRDLRRIERQSDGMIKVTTEGTRPEEPDPDGS
jgi:hypothetical protein